MTTYTCTYSPDDDKIRLYASSRLDAETYERVKAAGFRWAPKQDLFFTTWTPRAEDIGRELAGEVEDEDKSLTDRAEERADRFEGYRDNRTADAESARKAVAAIADNIPFGQPILVGHHSERRARKDAERIQNGMHKAVKAWETAEYWKDRAHGAIRHAKYKELPAVRARRIKTLEADKRRFERSKAESEKWLAAWNKDGLTIEEGRNIANYCRLDLAKKEGDKPDFDGKPSAWDALTNSYPSLYAPRTLDEVIQAANNAYPRTIAYCDRWIAHYENRLTYERAMLEDQGATDLLAPKPKPKHPPIMNYREAGGVISVENRYRPGETDSLRQVDMTAAEYAAIDSNYKGCSVVEGSHRVRVAIVKHARVCVFLTDSKTHEKPVPRPQKSDTREFHTPVFVPREPEAPSANAETFSAMRDTLREGVKVCAVPQLFPTPPELAQRVIAEADIRPGHRVLEPSAGTGALVTAIPAGTDIVALEINPGLAGALTTRHPEAATLCCDFLEERPGVLEGFDRIVANPPFADGQDLRHVTHALKFLKPGGRLVAIMSAGVTLRQDRATRAFRAMVEERGGTIEDLPEDAFKVSGTGVRAVLVTVDS